MLDSQNTEVSVNHTQRVRPTDLLGLSEGFVNRYRSSDIPLSLWTWSNSKDYHTENKMPNNAIVRAGPYQMIGIWKIYSKNSITNSKKDQYPIKLLGF